MVKGARMTTSKHYACDTGKLLSNWILYKIQYNNEGRSESCYTETREGALKTKDFLKFQGAKRIKILNPK